MFAGMMTVFLAESCHDTRDVECVAEGRQKT